MVDERCVLAVTTAAARCRTAVRVAIWRLLAAVQLSPIGSRPRFFQRRTHEASTFPLSLKRVAQKFHFSILRIEVTGATRGLSAIAELFVYASRPTYKLHREP